MPIFHIILYFVVPCNMYYICIAIYGSVDMNDMCVGVYTSLLWGNI